LEGAELRKAVVFVPGYGQFATVFESQTPGFGEGAAGDVFVFGIGVYSRLFLVDVVCLGSGYMRWIARVVCEWWVLWIRRI
jgi:hypothetical protein